MVYHYKKGGLTSLQALRYLSAMLVILFHIGVYESGYKGVDMFFIISGFVMHYNYYENKAKGNASNLKRFFIHRFTKIYLLYISVLLIYLAYYAYPLNSSSIGTALLLPGHKMIIPVSWSLSYELFFYLIFGMLISVQNSSAQKRIFIGLFLLTLVTTCINLTSYSVKGTILNFFIGQNLWQFLLGVIAGEIYRKYSHKSKVLFGFSLTISLILFFLINLPYKSPISYLVHGILGFSIILSCCSIENHLIINNKIRQIIWQLGNSSYCIYLVSPLVLDIFKPLQTLSIIGVIAGISMISILTNYFYEDPALSKIREALMKRKSRIRINKI